jgi:probable HAF family extracellular repeat protein
MSRRLTIVVVTVVAVITAIAAEPVAAAAGQVPSRMRVVSLGALGGGLTSAAVAVNDRGQVAGWSATSPANETEHAFLWERGRMLDLGTLGGQHSHATAISERGHVVGDSQTADGSWHAFIWHRGRMTDLGTLGGSTSRPVDVNARGQVVGYSTAPDENLHAFLWEDGQMVDLAPDRLVSLAWDITERGQVAVDSASYTYRTTAFLWYRGQRTLLPGLSPTGGSAVAAVNERGQAAGQTLLSDFEGQPVRWQDGRPQSLGEFPGSAGAVGLNNRGEVLGTSQRDPGSPYRSFVWRDGVVTDLGSLGGPNTYAFDINDRGQVVGYSHTPEELVRAFRWQDGTMVALPALGLTSTAIDVNRHGAIVGDGMAGERETHAMLWLP